MILLTLVIGSLPFIVSYLIIVYLLSIDSDIHNIIFARLEEKVANIESKWIRGYEDLLIQCIAQRLELLKDPPVAACIIYKCLRQWRLFEDEKTNIFDRIIQTIGQDIEKNNNQDVLNTNDVLAYWLSNTSTLLVLLQRTFKDSDTATGTGTTHHQQSTSATTLDGRMTQSFSGTRSQDVNFSLIEEETIEVKSPALSFKHQLTTYAEKIHGMIRDNFKKEIDPLIDSCIQAARMTISNKTPISYWEQVVHNIQGSLRTLKSNNVPPFLVRKIFTQIFSIMNVRLFNSLLSRRECCTFSNGEYFKEGLSKIEGWCHKVTHQEYAGSAWDELKHIRQATEFLINKQKTRMKLDDIRHDLCPALNIQQLYHISKQYRDDLFNEPSVSPDLISKMRVMAEDSYDDGNISLFMEADLSIPFSVDDLSKSMDQINLEDIDPPPLIRENSGFSFLL